MPYETQPLRYLATAQAIENVITVKRLEKDEKFDWNNLTALQADLLRWLTKDE